MAKKQRILSVFSVIITVVALLAGAIAPVHAQGDYSSMSALLDDVNTWVDLLYSSGYSVANVYIDRMHPGSSYQVSRSLYSGNDYIIIGVGGHGVADLDLKLYDSDGNLIAKDTSTDNIPTITVSPSRSATYIVETDIYSIGVTEDPDGEYFFAYIIAFKGS